MTARLARSGSILAMLLLVAACGTTNPPAATQGPGGGGGTNPPAATQGAVATQDGGGGGGGEFTGAPCSLITTDEVAGVLGGSGWKAQEFPMVGGSGQCLYAESAGASAAATSITTGATVDMLWQTYAGLGADVTQVSGVGDKAIFLSSTATLFFQKGSTLIGITAGIGTDPEEDRLNAAKALGAIAAGRL